MLTREKINETSYEHGHGPGRVINIGSVAGILPQEAPTHAYDCSKAAVHHLTKKLSADPPIFNVAARDGSSVRRRGVTHFAVPSLSALAEHWRLDKPS